MRDAVLFIVFPYVAVALAVGGSLYRFFAHQFTYSSLSSQWLEGRWLFWGALPWHYGVVPVLLIHLGGFAIPRVMAILHGTPTTLYLAELIGKVLALLAFVGMLVLIARRLSQSKLRAVTTPMDWVVLVLLLNQVFLGLWTGFFYRWGAAWFIGTATPWVQSLATFRPQTETITALPWVPKLHFLNATLLIALVPLSRLVHFLAFPIAYLWRKLQAVTWNRRPASQKGQ
jgi:nitrate reductase gamma subunit